MVKYDINIEKTSRLRKIMWIYTAIFGTIVIGVLVFLWVKLFLYQRNLEIESDAEEYAAVAVDTQNNIYNEEEIQKTFLEYVDTATAKDYADAWYAHHAEHFDKEADVEELVTENIIDASLDSYKSGGYNLSAPKYILADGQEPVAYVSLTDENGAWQVSDIEMNFETNGRLEIRVPSNAEVSLNGILVSDEYAQEISDLELIPDYMEDLVSPDSYKIITIDNLLVEPEEATDVSISDIGGLVVSKSEDGIYYRTLDTSVSMEYQQKADDFINSLLHYYSMGKENAEGNMHSVLSYVASPSKAASVINESLSGVIWRVADYSISYETSMSPVYVVADNCYFVDVTYKTVNESSTYENSDSEGVYRVYFLDSGNGFKIMQFAGIK